MVLQWVEGTYEAIWTHSPVFPDLRDRTLAFVVSPLLFLPARKILGEDAARALEHTLVREDDRYGTGVGGRDSEAEKEEDGHEQEQALHFWVADTAALWSGNRVSGERGTKECAMREQVGARLREILLTGVGPSLMAFVARQIESFFLHVFLPFF